MPSTRRSIPYLGLCALLACFFLLAPESPADSRASQPPSDPKLLITGDLPTTGTLTVAALEQMSPEILSWSHNGKDWRFRAIRLESVLEKFGLDAGPKSNEVPISEKRSGYKFAIVATAVDGYQAVYSFAELASTNGAPSTVYLAWALEDGPLPAEMGHFRLVVPTDGEGARSIYQLTRLDAVDLRRIVPAGEDRK